MLRVLQANTKLVMFVEFWPSQIRCFGDDPREFLQTLQKLGFEVRMIDEQERNLRPFTVHEILTCCSGDKAVNLLCIKGMQLPSKLDSQSGRR